MERNGMEQYCSKKYYSSMEWNGMELARGRQANQPFVPYGVYGSYTYYRYIQ
jgi:hypothetical protein